MTIKKSRIYAPLVATAILAAGPLFGQQDTNQALINLLVKKGILSQQDVTDLKQELATEAAQAAPAAPAAARTPAAAPAGAPAAGAVASTANGASPLSFKIGVASFTPFGFLDFTNVYRNVTTGSAIGTGFNSIPFGNSTAGQLSEDKFSAQNSRLGLRIDSQINDTKVLGYVETDFLGNAPANLGVSSNSDTLRMRNYFADLRNGPWEFLAGQDWSMLTPNRKGISPLPSDVFYTNDMDTNYQAGLTWARQPQVRLVYHYSDEFTVGASLENPDQYVGSAVALPSSFTSTEVDTGAATTQPNVFPDVIVKAAYDTKVNNLPWHMEIAGLERNFKVNTFTSAVNGTQSATGTGASAALNLQVAPGFSLIGTGFYSYGGGRYINGLGPDFVITPSYTSTTPYGIGLVKASSAIVGAEWAVVPEDTVSVYWSQASFGQRFDKQAGGGAYVGYGFPGSASSNNKDIEEFTLANSYTFWKNPNYGALQLIGQVSYVDRQPWYVAAGTPSKANATMVFIDLRYVLP
jgi:hypothetical protein